ncbi:MAG TPA: thermonuclease family protein, partial [Dehalococcoidia bacterium]|nr:thermonuclease family protein [Dehalococcoidia bacterium]
RKMDEFNQVLAYVYTEAGDSVDEILVREGLALAWTGDGQHRGVLIAAEREAQQQGIGCLWQRTAEVPTMREVTLLGTSIWAIFPRATPGHPP